MLPTSSERSTNNLRWSLRILAAREAGALGAKLTGGGRGGCMIALANDQSEAEKIRLALLNAGAVTTWMTSLNQEEGL